MAALYAAGACRRRKFFTLVAGLFLSPMSAFAGLAIQAQTATVSTEWSNVYSIYGNKITDSHSLPSGTTGSAVLRSEQNATSNLGSTYSQYSEYSLSAGDQALEMNVRLRGEFHGTLAGRGSEGIAARAQTQLVFAVGSGDVASFSAEAEVYDAQMLWPTLKLYRQDPTTSSWTVLTTYYGDGYVRNCDICGYPGSPQNPLSLTSGVYRFETSSLDGAALTAPGFANNLKVIVSIGGASAPPIPEPSSILLMGLGLAAVGLVSRRRRG